jgi:membrane protein YdbS with pleckstrin-like domain
MYQEIRKKAKKKVQAKLAFYICTVVFSFTAIILLMLSYYMPSISFWLRLPLPIFLMVLAVLYLVAFGFPSKGAFSEDWEEEEIEKEMIKLYRNRKAELPPLEDSTEEEMLELKKLERLTRKWDRDSEEDYV